MSNDAATRAAVGRPNLDAIPAYKSFLDEPGSFLRIHIHLIGVRSKEASSGIKKRRTALGTIRLVDAVADPYVVVETVGSDTGSTTYFPIGKHKFATLKDCQLPLWDAKSVVLTKKEGTDGIKFTMLDENRGDDDVLVEFVLPLQDLPSPVSTSIESPGEWTEFVRSSGAGSMKEMEFVFRLKVTDGADWIVSPNDTASLLTDTPEVAYTEEVIASDSGDSDDHALLQCWRQKESPPTKRAALWILGRNDCFMHPHVARPLLFAAKYDLYVLNYSQNGCCRKKGWVRDAHLNSHNKHQDFNVYIDQIEKALVVLGKEDYDTVLGYAHSTGGPVLLNYLIERGDDDFDGFCFNSPFLDWGFVGGDIAEFVLEHVGVLEKLRLLSPDKKLGAAVTPEPLKDTPLHYLGEDIVLSDWSAKIWSLYHFDWACRPLYKVPMTGGFAKGVTKAHSKIEDMHKKKRAITSKPFLCITSRGDDVLKAAETTSRTDWIGPSRCEVELNDNGHDVFLSQDASDTALAIDMVKSWMKCHDFC